MCMTQKTNSRCTYKSSQQKKRTRAVKFTPGEDSLWVACKHAKTLACPCCSPALVNPHLMLSVREIYALAGVNL